jgi:hypothetical protein
VRDPVAHREIAARSRTASPAVISFELLWFKSISIRESEFSNRKSVHLEETVKLVNGFLFWSAAVTP